MRGPMRFMTYIMSYKLWQKNLTWGDIVKGPFKLSQILRRSVKVWLGMFPKKSTHISTACNPVSYQFVPFVT